MTAKVLQPRLKLTQLTYVDHAGAEQRVLIRNTRCELVSAVGALVADDKAATLALAREHGLPVPTTEPFRSPEQARAFLEREGRIVVKPSDAGHGDGVTTNLTTFDAVMHAVEFAKKHTKGPSGGGGSGEVLLQTHCDGDDYRVLVVGGKMVAATHRMPAFVVGDGEQSIGALIAQKNADPRRGTGHDAQLTVIDAAEAAEYLASSASGRSLDTVPSSGERVNVLGVANLSRGGESRDVTDVIHPELVELCERFARVAGLGVCGADLVCPVPCHAMPCKQSRPTIGMPHRFCLPYHLYLTPFLCCRRRCCCLPDAAGMPGHHEAGEPRLLRGRAAGVHGVERRARHPHAPLPNRRHRPQRRRRHPGPHRLHAAAQRHVAFRTVVTQARARA